MTTTDQPHTMPAPTPGGRRTLRRSTTDRVGAGVAGGLGEYFGVDPVLFRVLFATSAFFGGAGILAYLIAWAVIPERGTANAPIDGWVGELRRRHIPPWLVAVAGGLLLWAIAFSWWAPGPFIPVVAVTAILISVFGRRAWQAERASNDDGPNDDGPADAGPVNLTKDTTAGTTWVNEARAWFDESKAVHRARRRRALPVKIATLCVLAATLGTLVIVDSARGLQIQTYFWTALAIIGAGLLVGLALRRTPWSIATLLPVVVAGCLAFAGSLTQFGDGIGHQQWRPTDASVGTNTDYRLAFGKGVLDLRSLPTQPGPRTFNVRLGAGKAEVIAPSTMNLTVDVDVHIGQLTVDGSTVESGGGGIEFDRTVNPPAAATGAPITVNVELTDGEVTVDHLQ